MPLSKADVMNLALRYLGVVGVTIEDPDDATSPFAATFSDWWELYVPKEIEQYDWRFARIGQALTISGDYDTSPYGNLQYVYQWPEYCLVPRFIPGDDAADNIPFEIGVQGAPGSRERLIYTARQSAWLVYSADVTQDYALFTYAFGMMLSARFAVEYATKKMGAGKALDGLKELYAASVAEARQVDTQMGNDPMLWDRYTPRYVSARGDGESTPVASQFSQG